MSLANNRRTLACGLLVIFGLFLATAYHIHALRSYEVPVDLEEFGPIEVAPLPSEVAPLPSEDVRLPNEEVPTPDEDVASPEEDLAPPDATRESEIGTGEVGKHFHIDLSHKVAKAAGVKGCEYPLVIHVTPDQHCTGALALYGSIVRNVLIEPILQNKTCVHFTYVDPELATIQEMYRWPARPNPFTHVKDCAALDSTPTLNDIVPVRFQALVKIEKPAIMEADRETWLTALNKVHSWGFDLYTRILILDADSVIISNLHRIMNEPPMHYTVVGAADQFWNCRDRGRINGGMILLRPSRYFHIAALERLYDPDASCHTGKWAQSEQELLNCICGTVGEGRGAPSEFACKIMPLYNSLWPRNYGCSAANVLPIRSIHFAAVPKPWLIEEERLGKRFDYAFWACVRNAARHDKAGGLTLCNIPGLDVTRTFPDRLED